MPEEKLPPHNLEAEEAVLGSLLLDPTCIVQIADFLRPDDFYREKNKWVYEADVALYDRHDVIDVVTLCDEMERHGRLAEVGGAAYITSLMNAVPTAVHVEHYAHIVERCATLRRLIHAGSEIVRLGYEEDADVAESLDKAEQLVFGVAERRLSRDFVSLREALREYFDQLDTLHAQKGRIMGIPTGFHDLDELLNGLHKSDLIIVAGRPSAGKTSFATSLAHHAAVVEKKPVAMFSLEMSVEQLVQRLLCSEANVDSHKLRAGYIDDTEWQRIIDALGTLSEAPIFIDDSANISAMELRTKARRLKAEFGISAIFIDYLQLMQGSGRENRVQEVSEISRSLKGLARELDVPVVALSQLSRAIETRSPHIPILSDLRESGCLTGDTPIFLPDTGRYVPIQVLTGRSDFQVMGVNTQTWKLEPTTVTCAFNTGIKPVYRLTTQLGRTVRATANHQFLTIRGWKRLDALEPSDRIALPRTLAGPSTQSMNNAELALLGHLLGDVYWDRIGSIEADSEEDVFDLTVPGLHNFTAGDVIVHNSIEQDADVVIFVHREEMYNQNTEKKNIADIIVAKHRNGPVGQIPLRWFPAQTKFADLAVRPSEGEFAEE